MIDADTTDGPAAITLSQSEFRAIARLMCEQFGIRLTEQKRLMVHTRLASLLHRRRWPSYAECYRQIVADRTGELLLELADRLATTHSLFFREAEHYTVLREQLIAPALAAGSPAGLRIWSAGCAAGEEAYTAAMVIADACGDDVQRLRPSIIATDIARSALAEARAATYPAARLQNVPDRYHKYLQAAGDGRWSVRPEIRALVDFRQMNLMRSELPPGRPFHAIFCRNVMIYFDPAARAALVQRLASGLAADGLLFIGHSEALGTLSSQLRYLQPTVYQRGTAAPPLAVIPAAGGCP